jgi:hypothetical protein
MIAEAGNAEPQVELRAEATGYGACGERTP